LIGNGAENEAPVRFQIIVLEKFLAAFKRQIGAVDEVLVKLVELGIDVIDPVLALSINHEQQVRQCIRRVRVVSNSQDIELGARTNCRNRTRPIRRSSLDA
jgi:hypothetical protein